MDDGDPAPRGDGGDTPPSGKLDIGEFDEGNCNCNCRSEGFGRFSLRDDVRDGCTGEAMVVGLLASLSAATFIWLEPLGWPEPRASREDGVDSAWLVDGDTDCFWVSNRAVARGGSAVVFCVGRIGESGDGNDVLLCSWYCVSWEEMPSGAGS
jgi:hypothetical protein